MLASWSADSIAAAAWFANARSACRRVGVGTRRSAGSSAQITPLSLAGAVVERDDEAVAVPCPRAAAVARGRVDRVQLRGQQRDRLVVLEQRAALLHHAPARTAARRVPATRAPAGEVARLPADRGERPQRRVLALGQRDHHLGEPERVADAGAHRAQDLGGGLPRPDLRRDAQQVLHRGAVTPRLGGRLHVLQRGGRVVADGRDEREPRRRRAGGRPRARRPTRCRAPRRSSPTSGISSRSSGCHAPGSSEASNDDAHERVVARPVDRAGRHEVGAAVVEAVEQQLAVLAPSDVVVPISASRATSSPSSSTTSKSSHAGRCRSMQMPWKPVARRSASATAASTACGSPPPARSARPIASTPCSGSWGTGRTPASSSARRAGAA